MNNKELLDNYFKLNEELREREKTLILLRRQKLEKQKRFDEISQKNRQQILQRLDKETEGKIRILKSLEEKEKDKKKEKLELEKSIRELNKKLHGFDDT